MKLGRWVRIAWWEFLYWLRPNSAEVVPIDKVACLRCGRVDACNRFGAYVNKGWLDWHDRLTHAGWGVYCSSCVGIGAESKTLKDEPVESICI